MPLTQTGRASSLNTGGTVHKLKVESLTVLPVRSSGTVFFLRASLTPQLPLALLPHNREATYH